MHHLAITGDVVITSLATIGVAAIAATATIVAARRAGRTEKTTAAIAGDLRPNGGTTTRDAIDRLERRTTAHDERFGRIEASNERLAAGQAELVDLVRDIARRQRGEEDQ